MPVSTAPHDTHRRSDTARTVLIASEDLVARCSETADDPTELIAIADSDARHAADIIRRHGAHLVVLEQIFAVSAVGRALLSDLRSNPQLEHLEIRMLPEDRADLVSRKASGHALARMSTPLGRQPSPRARRLKMRHGTTAVLDGVGVEIVELSTSGLQVVASTIVKPHQAARVVIRREDETHRAAGIVIWSRAELTADGLMYHAGISFSEDCPELLASVLSNAAE